MAVAQLPLLAVPAQEQFRFMGHHDQNTLSGQVEEQIQHLTTNRPVEARGGFIEEQDLRFPQELHGQGQPSLLPTTEPLRSLSAVNSMQSNLAEGLNLVVTTQSAVTQFQFLAHAQSQEVAFRELEDDTAKPASLALIQR